MLRLTVLFCLAAFAAAKVYTGQSHCCSAGDRAVVQEQWNELWHDVTSSKLKIGFGKLLILKLAESDPKLKEAFATVDIEHPNSGKFQAYSLRVLGAFDLLITVLDDDEALDAATSHMAQVWSGRKGFTVEHFKTLGAILKNGLNAVSEHFDPMAWKSCLGGIFKRVSSKLPH